MRLSGVSLAALLWFFSIAFAQSPSQSVDTSANQVVVDVVVTDDANQPVSGLREQDFQIFENNVRQQVRSFETHEERPELEVPKVLSLPVNTFTNANLSKAETISVILLDQLSTSLESQKRAIQQLTAYLAQKPSGAAFAIFVLRNDDMACRPYNRARWSFGITDQAPDSDLSCSWKGKLLLVEGITDDKDRLLAALKGEIVRPHPTWLRARLRVGWVSAYGLGPADVYDTSMTSLAEIGNFLQDLPGRKSLIWISDHFDAAPVAQHTDIWFPPKFKGWEKTDPFSPTQMIHLAAGRLGLARAALYPVDLTGKRKNVELDRLCWPDSDQLPSTLMFTQFPIPIAAKSTLWSAANPFIGSRPRLRSQGEASFMERRELRMQSLRPCLTIPITTHLSTHLPNPSLTAIFERSRSR
ncbi:MAG: VWA domain-containing protein [Acidobacteriia bacterium]|nr:VWA domain-containing protein [Terriglobia bacterium]